VTTADSRASRLGEVAWLFFKLGTIAFGGPAAHIAMMEDEAVRRRNWVTREQFLDLLGAANLIPGPTSTEMTMHLGYRRAGWPGLFVAGTCFIVPAACLVAALAWAYVRFGTLPQAAAVLYGVKPVVIAIVAQAMWNLARTAIKSRWLGLLGAAAAACALAGAGALTILASAGTVAGFRGWRNSLRKKAVSTANDRLSNDVASTVCTASGTGLLACQNLFSQLGKADVRGKFAPVALAAIAILVVVAQWAPHVLSQAPTTPGPGALFLYFLKVGSVLYGSGYVLLAFLQKDLVAHWHWLTSRQLLDAIAVGQVTPGPVFTTATFIGYILRGPVGAVAATVGIFLPGFLLCTISGPLVGKLRRSEVAGAFLDGVNVASLALMAAVAWALTCAALIDAFTIAIALASGAALFRYRINSMWLIVGGAILGLAGC